MRSSYVYEALKKAMSEGKDVPACVAAIESDLIAITTKSSIVSVVCLAWQVKPFFGLKTGVLSIRKSAG